MRVFEIVYSNGATSVRTESQEVSVTLSLSMPGVTVIEEKDLGEMTPEEYASYVAQKTG